MRFFANRHCPRLAVTAHQDVTFRTDSRRIVQVKLIRLSEEHFPSLSRTLLEANRLNYRQVEQVYVGIVAKPNCTVVLLMVLTLGACLGLPAEDVLDAVYDESETLPLESTPLFSRVVVQMPTRTPQPTLKSGSPFHLGSLGRCCERRAEQMEQPSRPITDSLTILDHSLRC